MLLRLQHIALAVFAIGALFWAAGEILQDIGRTAPAFGAYLVGQIALCMAVAIGLPAAFLHDARNWRDRAIRARFAAQAAALRVRAGR